MKFNKFYFGIVAASSLILSGPAMAQQGRIGDFDPLGIRAGTFLIHPGLSAGVSYDDNIFAASSNEEDDFIFDINPRLVAQSNWDLHEAELELFSRNGLYLDNDDSDFFDFGAVFNGRLDVKGGSALRTRLSAERRHEDRDAPDEDTANPDVTEFFLGQVRLSYRQRFNRLFVEPLVELDRRDFDDAGDINNDDRDRTRYGAGLRVGYDVSPAVALFAEGILDTVEFDEDEDDGGTQRDNDGLEMLAGAEIELTGKLTGEVSGGYTITRFDDGDLNDADGFTANTRLVWDATPLTTVTGFVVAGVDQTTVTFEGDNASANLETDVGVSVRHELRENIILEADGAYNRDDFEGTGRTDDLFRVGAGVEYLLNRNVGLNVNYGFTTRNSDDNDAEFDRSVVRIGIDVEL